MHMNLNLGKLDSTIRSLQEIVEAQQATIDSLEAGSSFDGDYNSLSNMPTIPSKTNVLRMMLDLPLSMATTTA